MKSKERPWTLTKEGPTHEVKKDHEGPKAQKEGKIKKRRRRRRGPRLRPRMGSLHPQGSGSFKRNPEDPENDVDSLEDPEEIDSLEDSKKDVGDLEDRKSHSHVSLKEGKE